jgi:prolyl oligopeptidase PreP (S9A serine peptidase family)
MQLNHEASGNGSRLTDAVTAQAGEFDMTIRQFVADGLNLPEAKSDLSWEDEDTVLVGTDFGDCSLTDSGYPLLIKRWRRGTPLKEAETIFPGSASDVPVTTCVSGRVSPSYSPAVPDPAYQGGAPGGGYP